MTEYTDLVLSGLAQVLHMRRERSHLTAEQQCTRCGEAAVVTLDETLTESCIHHHEDDARELLLDLERTLRELRETVEAAGHLMDPALLEHIGTAAGRKLEVSA